MVSSKRMTPLLGTDWITASAKASLGGVNCNREASPRHVQVRGTAIETFLWPSLKLAFAYSAPSDMYRSIVGVKFISPRTTAVKGADTSARKQAAEKTCFMC